MKAASYTLLLGMVGCTTITYAMEELDKLSTVYIGMIEGTDQEKKDFLTSLTQRTDELACKTYVQDSIVAEYPIFKVTLRQPAAWEKIKQIYYKAAMRHTVKEIFLFKVGWYPEKEEK